MTDHVYDRTDRLCPFCAVYHRTTSSPYYRCLKRINRLLEKDPDLLADYQAKARSKRRAQDRAYREAQWENYRRVARQMGWIPPNEQLNISSTTQRKVQP